VSILEKFMLEKNLTNQKYLGDVVYAGFDGYQVWLLTVTCEGDFEILNKIALDRTTAGELLHYLDTPHTPEQKAAKIGGG
jgi:hypothetical protein